MSARPGWYADPSGLPGTFRWWDGQQWTAEVTTDPGAPSPGDAGTEPPTEAAPAPEDTGAPRPEPPVPPPPGAPGPGYVPTAASRPAQRPDDEGTEILESGPREDRPARRGLVTALLVVLALVAVTGGFLAFRNTAGRSGRAADDAGAASPQRRRPDDVVPPPRRPGQAPFQGPRQNPGGPRGPDRVDLPHLTFDPLGGRWRRDVAAARTLLAGYAQTQVTEPGYDGFDSWVAMVVAGAAPADLDHPGDLAGTAHAVARWFARTGFAGAEVRRTTVHQRAITVDGHQGVLLEQHFAYRVEHLRSHGETVYVAIVDVDVDSGTVPVDGAFIASIPETDKGLVEGADHALRTLHVVP